MGNTANDNELAYNKVDPSFTSNGGMGAGASTTGGTPFTPQLSGSAATLADAELWGSSIIDY